MADNVQIKTYTSCINCEKPFENCDPLVLPCLHSICSVCHEGISNTCPRCSEEFPASLLAQHTIDHRRTLVPDFIKNKSEEFRFVPCQECAENHVLALCTICSRYLCAECLKNHDKYTKGHKKVNVDELRDMRFLDIIMPLQCTIKNHQNLPLKRYCHTDRTVICDLCESSSHKAQDDHRVEDIETACLKKRHDLETVIAKCEGNINAISNQAVNVQNEIGQLIQVRELQEKEIDASINNIIEWLERRRTYLKAGLNEKIKIEEEACNRIIKSITNAKDALEETSIAAKNALEYVGPEDFCQIENLISNRHQVLQDRVRDICEAKMPNQDRLLILPAKIMKLEEFLSFNSWLSVIDYTLNVPEEITIGVPVEDSVKIGTLTVNKSTHNQSIKPFDIAVKNADDEEMQTQVTYDDINQSFAILSKISCTGVYTLELLLRKNQHEKRSQRVVFGTDNRLEQTDENNYNPMERIDNMDHKELQRELQCQVCKEDFSFEEERYPRLLPCLHVIGRECLNKFMNGDQLTCPICEETHEIQNINVDLLPRDYSKRNLDMYRKLKWDKNLVHCEKHDSTKASFCCHTCGIFACETCSNYSHSRNGHVVSSLEELDHNMQISQLHKSTLCDVTGHFDKHIEFFCAECQKLICPTCYLEQHYTHEVKSYKTVYDKNLVKLKSMCTRISVMKQATKQLNRAADEELLALDSVADKELGKVRCAFNNHELALDERKRTLVSQIKRIRNDKKDVLKRQQHDLKIMEKFLDESLSHASDFQTFSNENAFITNFSFVERRLQKAIEMPIDTTLSEQAVMMFLHTKGTKRFENDTEYLGKIWPGNIHLPYLKYTIHPVILDVECVLVSIQFYDKHGTVVSVTDIKKYIEAILSNDQHETISRAITQITINENGFLEVKGSIHEPGTYTLMVNIAKSSIKKDGFTLIPEPIGEKQYSDEKTDTKGEKSEVINIEEKQNGIDKADVNAKKANMLNKDCLVKVDDSEDNGQSVKKIDFIDKEQVIEKEDSVDTEDLFGDGDSVEKEHIFTKIDSADIVEKNDSIDKGHFADQNSLVVKTDLADKEYYGEKIGSKNKGHFDEKEEYFVSKDDGKVLETNSNKSERSNTLIDKEETHIARLSRPSVPEMPLGFTGNFDLCEKCIVLSWKPPEDDGGQPIIDYGLEYCSVNEMDWVHAAWVKDDMSWKGSDYFTGGVMYRFRVTARNEKGLGEHCYLNETILFLSVPSAPVDIKVIKIKSDAVKLIVQPPENNGGLTVDRYWVRQKQDGQQWTELGSVRGISRAVIVRVPNLTPETYYYFGVCAENPMGKGNYLDTNSVTVLPRKLNPPGRPKFSGDKFFMETTKQ